MDLKKPATRPANPRFSSGPCAKYPTFSLERLSNAPFGRSHRADIGKQRLKTAIESTREILEIPENYRIAIVPASDTGAVELALWNFLGARSVTVCAWESFGKGWLTDVVQHLNIPVTERSAEYGDCPNFAELDYDTDVVFTWNGTTSGVRVPTGDWIPDSRKGLTICDATSAAFAMELPWSKLDVTTFSWQKVLGGEAAHGMLILSPRAVERLNTYTPNWPLPKIFRISKGGKLTEGIFEGATINTPSMLCVEDYLAALEWARSIGGLQGLIARTDGNAGLVDDFVQQRSWVANLANDPKTASTTSVCLKFTDPAVAGDAAFAKAVSNRLAEEGVAFDIGHYRDAPPGLRIWCGATVASEDISAMLPWLDWAYATERAEIDNRK